MKEYFEKLQDYVLENFHSDKMTPEIRDELFSNHWDFIHNMGYKGSPSRSAPKIISIMRKDPTPTQRAILKAMYSFGSYQEYVHSDELCNATGCRDIGDFVPLYFLDYMDVVDFKSRSKHFQFITPDSGTMKQYWPEIETWKSEAIAAEYEKPTKATRGQRIREVLKILGKNSIEEVSVNEIDNLGRIDWKIRGLNIPQSTLPELKELLLKKIIK